MTHRTEASLQVRAYLKRMAANYSAAPAMAQSDEIETLLAALQRRRAEGPAGGDLALLAGRYAAAPDAALDGEIEALLSALGSAGGPAETH